MFRKRRGLSLAAIFIIISLMLSPPAAQAGLMDSIKGFFSKASNTVKGWFSGGGEADFKKMLDQTEQTQVQVAELQNSILDKASRAGNSGIKASDTQYQSQLNKLSSLYKQNEQQFVKLLQVRQELVDKKKDVSKYQEQLARIQKTQHSLEEGYQALQDFNRKIDVFKPPSEIRKDKPSAADTDGPVWANPEAQKYMDEWLAMAGLDEWGRLVNIRGLKVKASAKPDNGGRSRHHWLWTEVGSDKCGANISLRDYVLARLNGKHPTVRVHRKQGDSGATMASAATGREKTSKSKKDGSSSDLESAVPGARGSTKASVTLSQTEQQLKAAMSEFQSLQAQGKEKSTEAVNLLRTIKVLKAQRDEQVSLGRAGASSK